MEKSKEQQMQTAGDVPFLLRVISILIIVEGALGFLFFTFIFFYQMYRPEFLSRWGYGQYYDELIYLIIAIYAIVHFGLGTSGIYLLRLDKKGIYIALLSIIMLLATGFLLHDKVNWLGTIAGVFVFILLSFYVKSFK